jgi:hypothetical protein
MFGGSQTGASNGQKKEGPAQDAQTPDKLDDAALEQRKQDLESQLDAVQGEMTKRNRERIAQFGSNPAYADRLRTLGGMEKTVYDEATDSHFFKASTKRERDAEVRGAEEERRRREEADSSE